MSTRMPDVRVVRVRLDGQGDDAGKVAEMLAQLLPGLSGGRVQVGEISHAYPNRRNPGSRRYFELYLLDEPGTAEPATGSLTRAVRTSLGIEP